MTLDLNVTPNYYFFTHIHMKFIYTFLQSLNIRCVVGAEGGKEGKFRAGITQRLRTHFMYKVVTFLFWDHHMNQA